MTIRAIVTFFHVISFLLNSAPAVLDPLLSSKCSEFTSLEMRLRGCISQALSVCILIKCSCASPQESNATSFVEQAIFLTSRAAPNDIVKTHDYTIQHCSLLTPMVQTALEDLYNVLQLAIWETHYGITSAPYRAFFKSSYYETVVDQILSSISIGVPIRLESEQRMLVPSLVCALKPDTVVVDEAGQEFDIFDICKENPTWTVMYYPNTSSIFICYLFFLMPTLPAAGHCPTVNEATNQFEGDFGAFWQSQVYMLLHEMAHFYIGATFEDGVDERMDWNYAFSLSPHDAVCNALNYVLFVASKCIFNSDRRSGQTHSINQPLTLTLYGLGVNKECHEFPQAHQSQSTGDRRLGETLGLLNTSSAEPSSQGLESVRSRLSPYHTDAMNMTLPPTNSTPSR